MINLGYVALGQGLDGGVTTARSKGGDAPGQVATLGSRVSTVRYMWEPVGPLPASVYWRRRWVAFASTIAAVVLVTWTVATVVAPPTAAEAATVRATRAAQASPSPATQPSAGPPTGASSGPSQPATGLRFIVPGPVPVPSTDPTPPATTSEELRPDDTPRPAVPFAPPAPVPPTGPVPCTNEMLGVTAEIDRPEHRVGERPVLRLVVTNVSGQPCVRDLDSARQEIVVWSHDLATRLWSSNDCVNATTVDLRTLVPGQPVAFAVTWAGRTTTPGCGQARTVVPAGPYQVMTRVDDDISPPVPFVRNP